MKHVRRFRCQPEAVTAARQYVRALLGDRSREISDAVELMTSELATNCVRHAHTDFELTIHEGEELRIEVRDTGPGDPRPRRPTPHELAGRGLMIVEAMSDAWGVIPEGAGKTVWFELGDRSRVREPAAAGVRGEQVAAGSAAAARRQAAG